jgi:hypothetical protein
LTTTVGLVAKEPEPGPDGRTKESSPKTFLSIGLVMLGIGLAMGIPGAIMAQNNRPVEQPGSTVTWFK